MNNAIILAGGSSIRFGGKTKKQFIKINGVEIIDYSIRTFELVKTIDKIIIVVPQSSLNELQKKYPKHIVVSGGASRRESSFNGLLACPKATEKVIIHDAARIHVSTKLIKSCIKALDKAKAVTLGVPSVDTIAKVKNSSIVEMENRINLFSVQTPQGFQFKEIMNAHKTCRSQVTDDIKLMVESGFKCKVVKGSLDNFKITTSKDLATSEYLINKEK